MDREISTAQQRKIKMSRWLWVAVALVAVTISAYLLRGALATSVKQSDIRTAIAEIGAIDNTLSATGEVQPAFEQVLTSPLTATLQNVYLAEGASVRLGEKIISLDKVAAQLDLDKQRDQLELKRNAVTKLKLDLDRSFYDLKIQDSIKAFKINALQADLENAKRLFKAGGGTRENIERAENDLHIAQLEKRQLENDLRSRQAVMQASIRETELTVSIQTKDVQAFENKLRQADIVATRSGILTYVNKNIGIKVNEGEAIARLADLSSFKILGSISDNYLPQMRLGMPVLVRLNDSTVRGTLVNIYPSVANNVVTFDVSLNANNLSEFKPKMKVEIFLVTANRSRVVRVANGAAFKGASSQDVFVVQAGGKLARRTVKIGLTNFDFVEITEGVSAGEKVVISDLSKFKNLDEIEVK